MRPTAAAGTPASAPARVPVRHLIAGTGGHVNAGLDAARRHVDDVDAPPGQFLGQRARFGLAVQDEGKASPGPAGVPLSSIQSVAETRTSSGSSSGQTVRTASTTSSTSRMRFSKLPPYWSVRSLLDRRQKLVEQVAVGGVDFHRLKTGPQRPPGRGLKRLDYTVDADVV